MKLYLRHAGFRLAYIFIMFLFSIILILDTKDVKAEKKSADAQPSESVSAEQLQDEIEQLKKRLDQLEKKLQEKQSINVSPNPDQSENTTGIEQLVEDEMGSVNGAIVWNGEPLSGGSVMIELLSYTGFSMASLKKIFQKDDEGSSNKNFIFTTQTDSKGQYYFKKVPPGRYRLYWKPDRNTGWVRRIREDADFEIIPGKAAIQNIPEKKK